MHLVGGKTKSFSEQIDTFQGKTTRKRGSKNRSTPFRKRQQANSNQTLTIFLLFSSSPVDKLSKLGEGTFGEAFRAGDMCFKIVPMGCDVKVNGEAQKVTSLLS